MGWERVLKRAEGHSGTEELRFSKLHTVLSVSSCADELASQAGLPQLSDKPGLLVTDNTAVRGWVAGGSLRPWVAHGTEVVHIKSAYLNANSHEDLWVDVMMLAMADCLVLSSSGFSYTALWMSNSTCFTQMVDCQKANEPRFAGAL
jgi:hypothetical protein